jgi:hypothetical protein
MVFLHSPSIAASPSSVVRSCADALRIKEETQKGSNVDEIGKRILQNEQEITSPAAQKYEGEASFLEERRG